MATWAASSLPTGDVGLPNFRTSSQVQERSNSANSTKRSGQSQTVLLADGKYKRLEPDQFRHHDVYQLLAYCTAIDVARGLLIYPAHEVSVRAEVHIRNTSVSVQQTMVDLGGSGEQLRQARDKLAGEVFSASGG